MKYKLIDSHYENLVLNIRDYFKLSNSSIHKERNEIKVIEYLGQEYVVKAFKVPNKINRVVYSFFRDSKAKKSYDNSLVIDEFVPKPIGYIEFSTLGLIEDSYFISERFNFDFTIREPLLDKDFENRVDILKKFSYFSFLLHEKGVLHLDYSPGNILVKKENDNYIFKIVDINRMKFKSLNINERMENFKMLWANEDDLKVIIKEYSKLINIEFDLLFSIALKYSASHKAKKNFKKRLKGKKVVD